MTRASRIWPLRISSTQGEFVEAAQRHGVGGAPQPPLLDPSLVFGGKAADELDMGQIKPSGYGLQVEMSLFPFTRVPFGGYPILDPHPVPG